jgi:multidrug efflux pump subunit AcrA (membrane-fusion protein)
MKIFNTVKDKFSTSRKWFTGQIARRPFGSFLAALTIFVGLLAASSAITKPKVDSTMEQKPIVEVSTFKLGTSPKVQLQAQLKNQGVITIQAQTSGVVQQINKKEGDKVSKGTQILWISSNYNGGTISTTQRQLAQTNYEFNKDNIELNKNAIANQRDLASRNRDNTEELRKITEKSVQETRDLISLNNELLTNIDAQITQLQNNNSRTPTEEAQLATLKGQKAQLSSGVNQLNSGLRSTEYQINKDNNPTRLADLQRDLTNKQLDLQEKALNLQLEVSRLNYTTAQISESFNHPSSPYAGTIERINVVPGQLVNPGETLVTITANNKAAYAESFVPQNIATQISKTSPTTLYIEGKTVEILPSYVSTQPTSSSLYSLKYQIPEEYITSITNNAYIKIDVPIQTPVNTTAVPFVPLDSIYQTQDGAYVYVTKINQENKQVASTQKIKLGQVVGNYVEVLEGLQANDQIILDRNVLEGDEIKTN